MKEREGWHVGVKKNEDGSLDYSKAAKVLDEGMIEDLNAASKDAENRKKEILALVSKQANEAMPGTLDKVIKNVEYARLAKEGSGQSSERRELIDIENELLGMFWRNSTRRDLDSAIEWLNTEEEAYQNYKSEGIQIGTIGNERHSLDQILLGLKNLRSRIVDEMSRK